MHISQQVKGDLNIYATSVLWAFFPIVTVLSYSNLNPLPSLAFSTLFATLFFAILLTIKKKWRELANRSALRDIFYVALFIGVGVYSFTFVALAYTTAGNVSLIGLLEIFFSYLLFSVWKREQFSIRHIVGSLLMISGAVIVLIPNATVFNIGDALAIIGVACAPIGNYFQRRARRSVSSETILFARSLFTVPIVFLLALLIGQHFALANVYASLWFLLVNGIVLLGLSKILWVEAIHRISVTRANALSSISPLLTLVFAYTFLDQYPNAFQLMAFFPLVAGLYLLVSNEA